MPNLLSPPVTISYPNLFKAKLRKDAKPGDKPTFSASFLFTQAAMDSPQTKALLAAVTAAAVAKFGQATFETMVREGTFENPFKRDVSSKGYPAHFVRYISSAANEEYPPAVVGRFIDPATNKLVKITDTREIYPGAVVIVSLSARAYGGPGTGWKPGVKLDLRNVQKVADGDRLSAGSAEPDDEFTGEKAAEPAGDDLASLLA